MGRRGHEVARPRARALERLHQPRGDRRGRQLEAVPPPPGRRGARSSVALVGRRGAARPASRRAARSAGSSCAGTASRSARARSAPPAMPLPASSSRSASVDALERELRRHVGAAPGGGDEAEHRRDHHHPPAARRRASPAAAGWSGRPGRRGWSRRSRASAARGRSSTAPGDGEGAVVDERVEPPAGAVERLRRRRGEARLVGEVEREALQPLGREPRAVLRLAAGREHPPAARAERARGVEADARGAAGDEDAALVGMAGARAGSASFRGRASLRRKRPSHRKTLDAESARRYHNIYGRRDRRPRHGWR